jgi:hypothetical protein
MKVLLALETKVFMKWEIRVAIIFVMSLEMA